MVSSIEVNRLNKCLEIQNRNNTYDVPFVDEIVKVIDKKKKLIIIDPPEGLKELNKK